MHEGPVIALGLRRFVQRVPMNDAGPPHLVASEFETLRALYDFQRDSFVRKVSGVSDAECVQVGRGDVLNLRWGLGHMLEEVARHAGHADIIRELLDGETGR